MRYVPGTDLHRLLKHEGPLEPERAADIVAQVASALDAAHAAGLVHRDVKPANVLIAGDHAYLGDFGLTRLLSSEEQLTETGQWLGTTDFSSPEQLQGERVDARADIYSLGCVLHAALLGDPPFPRSTVPATLLAAPQRPAAAAVGARRAAGLRPRDGARAGEGSGGPLSVGGRPRARGAGGGARRVGDGGRAQRRGRPRRARRQRPRRAADRARPSPSRPRTRGRRPACRREDETTVLPPRQRRRRALAGLLVGIAAAGTAVALIGNPGAGDGAAKRPRAAVRGRGARRRAGLRAGLPGRGRDGAAAAAHARRRARAAERGRARARARRARIRVAVPRAGDARATRSTTWRSRAAARAGRAGATRSTARTSSRSRAGSCSAWSATAGEPRIGLIAVTPNS